MIKNYIKIAWRNLVINKSYSAINIVGLSMGVACSILIFTLVNFHLSFDNFHKEKDRIYRVVTDIHEKDTWHMPSVPAPFAKALRNDYTFTEKVARAVTFWGMQITVSQQTGDKKFIEENGIECAEPEFFDVFNFPLVKGNIKTALNEPNTAIITQNIARKYFGSEEVIGKVLRVDNRADFKITGLLKNIPLNTDR